MANPAKTQVPERFIGTEWLAPSRAEEEEVLALCAPAQIVAALEPVLAPRRVERLREVVAGRLAGLVVLLENLHDPHNGGAALRSCESVGVTEIHVVSGVEPFRVARKVTQGCDKWLEIACHSALPGAIAPLKARGFRLYAAVPGAARRLEELDASTGAVFLVGNEHAGLSAEARAACDEEFAIPLHGFSQSVNLSVATALTVYTHATRRRAALGRPGDLSDAEAERLLCRYLLRELRGGRAIVEHHLRTSRN